MEVLSTIFSGKWRGRTIGTETGLRSDRGTATVGGWRRRKRDRFWELEPVALEESGWVKVPADPETVGGSRQDVRVVLQG